MSAMAKINKKNDPKVKDFQVISIRILYSAGESNSDCKIENLEY